MKKAKQLTIMARQFLIDDLDICYIQQEEITECLKINDDECILEYYYFHLLLVSQKIKMIQNILVENKF
jgi:hypothetical protein